MVMEPINLFSRIADPAAVAQKLRELCPTAKITGPDDNWSKAVVTFGDGESQQTLTLMHDAEYYAEPNWSTQMNGMRGYFSNFPDTDRKEQVMLLTTSFAFSLGTDFEPDFDPEGDPRLDVLFALAEFLDGVLFTPSALRDAYGRILFGAGGEEDEDPNAEWPRVRGSVDISDPLGAAMHEASRPKSLEEAAADADPPSAARIARRALAMTAVTARAILEQEGQTPNLGLIHRRMLAWVNNVGLREELEPEEWEVLQLPIGRLDQQDQINFTWRLEGLVVLGWALQRFELPPHDQLVDFNALWNSLGFLRADDAKSVLAKPMLRSREELHDLQHRLFAIHWRMRNFFIRPEAMDFAEFARTCNFGPLNVAGLPLIDGDIAVGGERIDRADQHAFQAAHSASQERHQAINWLCEGPDRYSEASVAT